MDSFQTEHDWSWMSFKPEAHNIKSRTSPWIESSSDRADEQKRNVGERNQGRAWRSKSLGGESETSAFGYDWREPEIVEEEDEGEVFLRQRRKERGKEQLRKASEDFDEQEYFNGASSSSVPPPPPAGARPTKFRWNGETQSYSFSPRSLGRGFQARRKSWMQSFDEVNVVNVTQSSVYPRLQFAAAVAFFCFLVALGISVCLLYLSLGAAVRPPGSCEVDKVILNFTAQRIRLKGGRHISFREQGVGADRAEHSLLVVHDLLSSRLAGIPGINASLLEEFGVRLISYDLPGYGQSDPHPSRSFNSSAQDMSVIADALGMGEKFWLVGFGTGGPHVWAAINYIPERLAGVALFAPAGNFYAYNMSKTDVAETWGMLTMRQKWIYSIARRFPALLPSLMQKILIDNDPNPVQSMRAVLGSQDHTFMEQPDILKFWKEDVREALLQRCAFPMAEELILLVDNWGFSLSDLPFKVREVKTLFQQVVGLFQTKEKPRVFSGPIHIWQGTDDLLVPATINEYARRMVYRNDLPSSNGSPVKLHLLEGEGHLSWFWFCHKCHRSIFNALFRPDQTVVGQVGFKGFSEEEYEAILAAFGGQKEKVDRFTTTKESHESTDNSLGALTRETGVDADDDSFHASTDPEETNTDSEKTNEPSTEMMIYVPESCQAGPGMSISVLRTIEEKVGAYIKDIGKYIKRKD